MAKKARIFQKIRNKAASIINPSQYWTDQQDTSIGKTVFDPYGQLGQAAKKTGWLKSLAKQYGKWFDKSEELASYRLIDDPYYGKIWGTNVRRPHPKTGEMIDVTMRTGCSCSHGIHPYPKPCITSFGCIPSQYDLDSTKPKRIYLTCELFFLSEEFYKFYHQKKMSPDKDLMIQCEHCVRDLLVLLIKKDPTLFVNEAQMAINEGHSDAVRMRKGIGKL